jgi:hypothetical protein
MRRELSFGDRLDQGASMPELMEYYALSENEYLRAVASLQEIRKNGAKK